MIKNQIKIALRALRKNLFFSSLNVLNIAVGMIVCLLAGSYIYHELSYDRFHENHEDIYRIGRTVRTQDYAVVGFESWNSTTAVDQQKQTLTIKNTAGVKNYVQFFTETQPQYLDYDNKQFEIEQVLTTNTAADFTEMFTWELQEGSFETFSNNKNAIIITSSVAERIHGTENQNQLIGKTIEINEQQLLVAVIIADVPATSHFDFNAAVHSDRITYWGAHLYAQRQANVRAKALEANISEAFFKFNPGLKENETFKGHFIQPVTDIHLKSNILYELKEPGNTTYLWLIGGFALVVLFITIFNYTNLTLALKFKNSKSIGVNQVLGASNSQMLRQFVIEALVQAFIAFPIVLILWFLALPYFNQFMGVQVENYLLENFLVLFSGLIFIGIYGCLLSIIPAALTLNKSAKTLLNTSISSKSFEKISLRKYLMISQIAILIVVTSISVFMNNQMRFINAKDLGFKKDGILFTSTDPENLEVFQTELRKNPYVNHVGNGSSFAIQNFNNINYKLQGSDQRFSDSNTFYLDFEGIKAYELETSLTQTQLNPTSRSRKNLINRSAAERFAHILGIKTNEMIGQTIITEPDYQNEDGTMGIPFVVDGIFEDINAFSLKNEIASTFIIVSDGVRFDGQSIVSVNPENVTQVMADIRTLHDRLGSSIPLEIELLSENYALLHEQDARMSTLILLLNSIAIILAILGITGTTILLLIGRKREIGIRKLLGASIYQIMNISVREYMAFIAIAAVISIPIAYYIVNSWMEDFAYRVDMNPLIFAIILVVTTLSIALIVALSSYRTAVQNPVNSINTE
jgi:putative ABC transport system permease protein